MKNIITISNSNLHSKEVEFQYIFLAGSMNSNNSDNWRRSVVDRVKGQILFLDPTNENFSGLNNEQMEAQINWELDALQFADNILLNFLPNATSPISLLELGLYVKSDKLIVVCPIEFYKSRYVYTLCEKYKTPCYFSLEEAIAVLLKINNTKNTKIQQ